MSDLQTLGLIAIVAAVGYAIYEATKDSKKKPSKEVITPTPTPPPEPVEPVAPLSGVDKIIEEAHKSTPENKLLYWCYGPITTLAQALKKDPTIATKLEVYWIASSNRDADEAAWTEVQKHKHLLELYRDEQIFREFYGSGNQSILRRFEEFLMKHPMTAEAWKKYPLSYRSGASRYYIKAGDFPTYLYSKDKNLRNQLFVKDGGQFYRDQEPNRRPRLSEDSLRSRIFNDLRASFATLTQQDGTKGRRVILCTDILRNGEPSDKDDQQGIIMKRGILKGYNVVAFISTNIFEKDGVAALRELFGLINLSHLKDRCYQGATKPFKG